MAYLSQASSTKPQRLIPLILALMIASIISFMSVKVSNQSVSLTWLPLLLIAMWPRYISPIWSVVLCLLFGLFVDWGSAGAPGQWALVYLSCYAFLRPEKRGEKLSILRAILNWLVVCFVAFVVFSVTGKIVYGEWPKLNYFAEQAGLATLLLPVAFMLRQSLRYFLTDPDERGY